MALWATKCDENQLEGGQFCPLWPPKRRLRPGLAALQLIFDGAPRFSHHDSWAAGPS